MGPVSSAETASLPPPRLKTGDILAGRFVVVELLAHGGMGEVYEATDRHLQDKRHAIKTLRADLARNPSFRQRFEREVLLAREVHHPNVCPTYDLFNVTDQNGPLSFLTMKLLRGESLHTRIRRERGLPPDVVKALATQIAAALDAAHARGVVHRDLKPGNIMLEDSSAGTHVSVTDFGLSRAFDAEDTIAPGVILGTPGYMAPEIMRGHTAGFPADVYAFGIVIYEMLTGRRPDDPLFPLPPSHLVPGLDPYWDKVTHGCLSSHPDYRFRSAGDALKLADRNTGPLPPVSEVTPRKRLPVRMLAGVAGLIAIAVTGWAAASNWDRIAHPLPEKRYVALMAWPAAASSAHQPLLRTAMDAISSRLSRVESSTKDLMIISASDVGGSPVLKAPTDAAAALGANLVLTTTIEDSANNVRLNMAVVEAASGTTIRARSATLANDRLARISDTVAALAADLLDLPLPPGSLKDQDEIASLPPAAFNLLTEADELFARPNDAGLDEAIAKYQQLLDSEPKFALGYAKLSTAYARKHQRASNQAVLTMAGRNADQALRFNPDSVAGLLSRATFDLSSGNTEAALTGLQRALDLDPANPQLLVMKARTYRTLDRVNDEEAVYREIVRNRPNFWPAYDQLGLSLYRQARYREAAQVFQEGAAIAPRIARLLNNLGAMQILMEQPNEALETFKKSVAAAPTPVAYQNLGTLSYAKQDYQNALSNYEKALSLNPKDELSTRNIGDVYVILGDRQRSLVYFEKGAALVEDALRINPKRGETWMIHSYYQAKLGHRGPAEAALKKAEEFGASGVPSQLKRVQTLVLLGRSMEALPLLIELRHKGLSAKDVELAIDLRQLRTDPGYLATLVTNP